MQSALTPPVPPRGAARRPVGVYVHFPWCLAKCPYCDFVSYVSPRAIDHRGYADAVLREIDVRAPLLENRKVESIFFGGGTPSLWDARELGRVIEGVRAAAGPSADAEVSVECNPSSLDERVAEALVSVGVNRLSIGVQSLNDDRLRFLGRLHDAAGAIGALRHAIRAGVPRVSGDLIFGLPTESPIEAREEAVALADLGLSHISAYQLTIEAGTRFGQLAKRGRLPLADDDAVAESFLAIDDALTARGLGHYEVSNYSRPGDEARHNLGYWRGDEYLGLGCGAYGYVRGSASHGISSTGAQGVRWRNSIVPEEYIADVALSKGTWEPLDGQTLMRERIMLGLRMSAGVDLDDAAHDLELHREGWTAERERASAWLVARGRVLREGSRVRVPKSAWLWTDDTAARLF